MNVLKEFWDTYETRVKGPIFGSFFLSFCLFNWKALFFLIFDKSSTQIKFEYFDQNTSPYTLLLNPLAAAVFFVLASPWIRYWAAIGIKAPVLRMKSLQNKSAHTILLEKQNLSKARRDLLASEEKALIEQAQRDQEVVETIQNDDIRTYLQSQIDELRNQNIGQSVIVNDERPVKLSAGNIRQIEILEDRIVRLKRDIGFASDADRIEGLEDKILQNLSRIDSIKTGRIYKEQALVPTKFNPDGRPFN